MTDLVYDRRTPPLEDLLRWAEVLGLRGKRRERFNDLAVLSHVPAVGRDRFLRFLDLMDRWEADERRAADGDDE